MLIDALLILCGSANGLLLLLPLIFRHRLYGTVPAQAAFTSTSSDVVFLVLQLACSAAWAAHTALNFMTGG